MIDELMIRVTYRCNKNCDFCFNNIFDDKVDYKSIECLNIAKISEFVNENGIKTIYISGGEPTVYENIENLTHEVSKMGKVIYFTNGMLFDKFSDEQITGMGISAINISIYTNEIIANNDLFQKKCNRLFTFKEKNPNIKLHAQVMVDASFFDVIKSEGYNRIHSFFDRINWQPLSVPENHYLYNQTLEGMDRKIVNEICDYLATTGMKKKVKAFQNILDGKINDSCLMGTRYITLNPDMTISICPHKNDKKLTIDEFNNIKNNIGNSNNSCLSMRCVSLQSFLNKKYTNQNY